MVQSPARVGDGPSCQPPASFLPLGARPALGEALWTGDCRASGQGRVQTGGVPLRRRVGATR